MLPKGVRSDELVEAPSVELPVKRARASSAEKHRPRASSTEQRFSSVKVSPVLKVNLLEGKMSDQPMVSAHNDEELGGFQNDGSLDDLGISHGSVAASMASVKQRRSGGKQSRSTATKRSFKFKRRTGREEDKKEADEGEEEEEEEEEGKAEESSRATVYTSLKQSFRSLKNWSIDWTKKKAPEEEVEEIEEPEVFYKPTDKIRRRYLFIPEPKPNRSGLLILMIDFTAVLALYVVMVTRVSRLEPENMDIVLAFVFFSFVRTVFLCLSSWENYRVSKHLAYLQLARLTSVFVVLTSLFFSVLQLHRFDFPLDNGELGGWLATVHAVVVSSVEALLVPCMNELCRRKQPVYHLADVYRSFSSGDLVLLRRKGCQGFLLASIMCSRWTHVGFVVRRHDKKHPNAFEVYHLKISESVIPAVTTNSLSTVLQSGMYSEAQVRVLRRPLEEDVSKTVGTFSHNHSDIPYETNILRFIKAQLSLCDKCRCKVCRKLTQNEDREDRSRMFCSEYCALLYDHLGLLDISAIAAADYTPRDFAPVSGVPQLEDIFMDGSIALQTK